MFLVAATRLRDLKFSANAAGQLSKLPAGIRLSFSKVKVELGKGLQIDGREVIRGQYTMLMQAWQVGQLPQIRRTLSQAVSQLIRHG